MLFKDLVKKLRDKLAFTQREISSLLNVNQTSVSCWERGERSPSRKTKRKFVDCAKLNGIKIEYTDIED